MHTATALVDLVDRRKRQAVGRQTPSIDPHVRSTNRQQTLSRTSSGPARSQFPVSTFPASTADLHLPRQLPLPPAPAGLQAWTVALQGPALSPPPSPPPSVPCPHLIAPLILAPLRNRLDDVPFRLNFFLGVRAVLRCSQLASQSQAIQAECVRCNSSRACPVSAVQRSAVSAGPVLFL